MKKPYLDYSDLLRGDNVDSTDVSSDYSKIGKVSAASVLKHTKKNWKQWVEILERAGARTWTHKEIVEFLKQRHKLSAWWQQGVALGFEIAIGRRKTGQDSKGKYMVTATKSLPCTAQKAWAAIASKEGQAIWLQSHIHVPLKPKIQFETDDGFFGEIRTVSLNRRVRLYWQDAYSEKHTVVEVLLVPKPTKKSLLVFNNTGIPNTTMQSQLRARWKAAAQKLAELLSKNKK